MNLILCSTGKKEDHMKKKSHLDDMMVHLNVWLNYSFNLFPYSHCFYSKCAFVNAKCSSGITAIHYYTGA